jgi:hypothetical protein
MKKDTRKETSSRDINKQIISNIENPEEFELYIPSYEEVKITKKLLDYLMDN